MGSILTMTLIAIARADSCGSDRGTVSIIHSGSSRSDSEFHANVSIMTSELVLVLVLATGDG